MWCHLDDVGDLLINFIIRAAARHRFHGEQKAKEQANKACGGASHDDDALQWDLRRRELAFRALTHLRNKPDAICPT